MRYILRMLALFQLMIFSRKCFPLLNVTVDDSGQDPFTGSTIQYTPGWNYGSNCTVCTARPHSTDAYCGTWHDSTSGGNTAETKPPHYATFEFIGSCVLVWVKCHTPYASTAGSAVYVYGLLSTSKSEPADIQFFLDGEFSSTFENTPPGGNPDVYVPNSLTYANNTIKQGLHVLTIQNGRIGGSVSLMLLDYVIYTTYVHSCITWRLVT